MSNGVLGHVDSWAPILKGWIIDSRSPSEPVVLSIFLDDVLVAKVECDGPRPDVLEAGLPSAWCGFEVPLGQLVDDSLLHSVSIVHSESGIETFRSDSNVRFGANREILRPELRGSKSVIELHGDAERVLSGIDQGSRVALLSTFRPAGASPEVAARLVDSLHAEGFVVIAVDTSREAAHSGLRADITLHRRNAGLDFASWHAGLEFLAERSRLVSQILLVNDSCYGPFAPLSELFLNANRLAASVVGLTEGWFGGYHLQSNFLLFQHDAVSDGVLQQFFESYDFPILKDAIVRSGEIGLSRFLNLRGHSLRALYPYEEVLADFFGRHSEVAEDCGVCESRCATSASWSRRIMQLSRAGEPVNVTHAVWDSLIEMGMPFVKRDLLTKNPMECPALLEIGSRIRSKFGVQDFDLINQDLKVRGERAVSLG